MAEVKLYPLVNSIVGVAGSPVTAIVGPAVGGVISNGSTAHDQRIPVVEPLFIDAVHPATPFVSATTFALQPGESWPLPPDFTGTVTVNAGTNGHAFSGYVIQQPTNFLPNPPGTFPLTDAEGNYITTTLTAIIKSYLYQQYSDDTDLQAFVDAYNSLTQQYGDWFAQTILADYTSPLIQGQLLDWVAAGLYGLRRPLLPLGHGRTVGPLNTWPLNTIPLNVLKKLDSGQFYDTTDDIFKRILTWHLYKDDGKVFDIRWLKRRVERFLAYPNGTNGLPEVPFQPCPTYDVSVTFGANNEVDINLQASRRRLTGGALLNTRALNTFYLNEFHTETVQSVPVSPLAPIFKAAMDAGVLEVPFQFKFIVNVRTT
jgi:hypothetical protein